MTINTAKLREIIPDLEAWTGGERRDLDAKIAEAFYGVTNIGTWCGDDGKDECGGVFPNGSYFIIPHYLGTDPAIVTEDMQRLVAESEMVWMRELFYEPYYDVFWGNCYRSYREGISLPHAWARAVIAKEDGEK